MSSGSCDNCAKPQPAFRPPGFPGSGGQAFKELKELSEFIPFSFTGEITPFIRFPQTFLVV